MALENYVKFLRGTPKAYQNLAVKDEDTLYFISEPESLYGELYLGNKLISGGEVELGDLTNVNLEGALDGDVLSYDAELGKWVAKDIDSLTQLAINSNVFALDADGALNLYGFAEAQTGAQLLKGVDGKLSWVVPEATSIEGLQTIVSGLQESVATLSEDQVELSNKVGSLEELVGKPAVEGGEGLEPVAATGIFAELNKKADSEDVATAIAEAIANADHLSRKKVASTDLIDLSAADVDKYIYLVGEQAPYTEYMVIDGALEEVGSWTTDLSDYAKIEDVNVALLDKVDKIEGYGLVSNENILKLESLSPNFITSVDTADFKVTDGHLTLNSISQSKIDGLEDVLSSINTSITNINSSIEKLDEEYVTKVEFNSVIGDMSKLLLDEGQESTTIVDEIVALQEAMKWHEIN